MTTTLLNPLSQGCCDGNKVFAPDDTSKVKTIYLGLSPEGYYLLDSRLINADILYLDREGMPQNGLKPVTSDLESTVPSPGNRQYRHITDTGKVVLDSTVPPDNSNPETFKIIYQTT